MVVEMEPLATIEDLDALGISTTNTTLVESLLESVSSDIRNAAGCPISPVTETIHVTANREQYLPLPVKPVTAIHSVEIDGVPVTGWRLVDGRLWRPQGWSGYAPAIVDVNLTFGQQVPKDIVRLTCMMVSAGVEAAKEGFNSTRGLTYESIDDSRVGYATGDNEIVDPAGLPETTRTMLRNRFSGGVAVTGGY
jgi:hypothetical protein